jgi:hypothetical protein
MLTYKEVFVDFESISGVKYEEINFSKSSSTEIKGRHPSVEKQIKSRGVALSFQNSLIFG